MTFNNEYNVNNCTNIKIWINDIVIKVNDGFNSSIHKDIKEIIDDIENIAIVLKNEHILTKEYYDFREIQRLLIKTLNEDSDNLKLEILLNILDKLVEITNFKVELLHKCSNEDLSFNNIPNEFKDEFKEHYEEFHNFLFKSKKEYYSLNKSSSNIDSKKYLDLMSESILN